MSGPPPPPPSTVIDRLTGQPIAGTTLTTTGMTGGNGGRDFAPSIRFINVMFQRLNVLLRNPRLWQGNFYNNRSRNINRLISHAGNNDLEKDSQLYKEFNYGFDKSNSITPLPLGVIDRFKVPSRGELSSFSGEARAFWTAVRSLGLTQRIPNSKAYWRLLPPQFGVAWHTNIEYSNAHRQYLIDIKGKPIPAYSNEGADVIQRTNNTFMSFIPPQWSGRPAAAPVAGSSTAGNPIAWYAFISPFMFIPRTLYNVTDSDNPTFAGKNVEPFFMARRTTQNPRGFNNTWNWSTNRWTFGQQYIKVTNNRRLNPNTSLPGIWTYDGSQRYVYGGVPVTYAEQQVEMITEKLKEEFDRIFGRFISDQIQMRVGNVPGNPNRLYKNLLSPTTNPGYSGLRQPNQLLYNIAVELVRSRWLYDLDTSTFNLNPLPQF